MTIIAVYSFNYRMLFNRSYSRYFIILMFIILYSSKWWGYRERKMTKKENKLEQLHTEISYKSSVWWIVNKVHFIAPWKKIYIDFLRRWTQCFANPNEIHHIQIRNREFKSNSFYMAKIDTIMGIKHIFFAFNVPFYLQNML